MKNQYTYTITGYFIIFFSFLFLLWKVDSGAIGSNSTALEYELTWTEFDGEDYEIFFSGYKNNNWSPKVKITDNNFTDLIPTVASGNNGIIWVVWPEIKDSKTLLFYSNFDGRFWSTPRQITTSLLDNNSPSVIVDKNNIPWIVWAGFDGQDDDIYYTRWNGANWDSPKRINRDNTLPDIMPKAGLDAKGNLWVSWKGYEGDRYKNYFSKWNSTKWDDELLLGNSSLNNAFTGDSDLNFMPELPPFVKERSKASIHVKIRGASISYRLGDLKKNSAGEDDYKKSLNEDQSAEILETFIGFGDSITAGRPFITGSPGGARVGGYEPKLENLLGGVSRPSYVLNYGVGGERTSSGVNRIDGVLDANIGAKAILIMEGTNDYWYFSVGTTKQNLSIMLDKSLAKNIRPVLSNLTPDTRSNSTGKKIATTYNHEIKDLAASKNVDWVDTYSAVVNNWSSFSGDKLHPNDAGYQVLAQAWFNTIQKPVPDIKANGSDISTSIKTTDTLSVELNYKAGGNSSKSDYWFVYKTPSGEFYYYSLSEGWLSGLIATYQGTLVSLNSYIVNVSGLSPGTYTFYFGIDLNVDNRVTSELLYFDSITVTVT